MSQAITVDDYRSQFLALKRQVKRLELSRAAVGAFAAHRSSMFGPNASGNIAVPMNAEDLDVSEWFDPTTGLYTPQLPGIYALTSQFQISTAPAAGTRFFAGVSRTGGSGSITPIGPVLWSAGGANDNVVESGVIMMMANGDDDAFEAFYSHNSGSSQSVLGSANTRFQGWYLGQ